MIQVCKFLFILDEQLIFPVLFVKKGHFPSKLRWWFHNILCFPISNRSISGLCFYFIDLFTNTAFTFYCDNFIIGFNFLVWQVILYDSFLFLQIFLVIFAHSAFHINFKILIAVKRIYQYLVSN